MSEASASTPLLSPVTHNENVKRSVRINRAHKPSDVPITWCSVFSSSVWLILIAVFCERLAFYSVLNNMVLFCMSELMFTGFHASMTGWIFMGSVYLITPLIGGYVADSLCGRYKTIVGSGVIYVIGKILLFFSACDIKAWFGFEKEGAKIGLFITSLVVITIGSGGIIANIAPFGAKQISHMGPRAVQSFYHWYYLAINIGSLASITVVYIQQQKSFYWGYLLSLLVLFLGLVVFLLGHRTYKHVPPSDSVIKKAITMRGKAWKRSTGRFEEGPSVTSCLRDVKTVLKILPIYGFITTYWMGYAQMSTSLFLQTVHLDISISGGVTIPPAFLNCFNPVMVVLFIPLMDFVIYPMLIRCSKSPTYIQRMGIGMFLAVLALCYAGGLEQYRKQQVQFVQIIANNSYNASNMSVFHQAPVFALLGLSEVWTSISELEFAYTLTPDNMQGLTMGLNLATVGLGSFYSIILSAILQDLHLDWHPIDPSDNGNMEYLFFLIAGITFFFSVLYVLVTRCCYTDTHDGSQTRIDESANRYGTEDIAD